MNKIKNFLKDYKLYIFFLITIAFFGTFAKLQYAVDTYSVFTTSTKESIKIFLTSGRFMTAIWFAIVGFLKLGNTARYLFSFGLAILFTTIALYKLDSLVKRFISNDFLSIIVTTLIIINPFSIEYFMYIEKGVLLFAVLLAVCAVEQFVKYLEGKELVKKNKKANSLNESDIKNKNDSKSKNYRKHLIFSGILVLLTTFSYQGVLAIYISIASIFIIKYSKNIKDFIINNVSMFLCYGLPAIINLLVIRIFFSNTRVNGSVNISEALEKIAQGSENMLYTYNILPKYFFFTMIIIATLISLIIIIKNKKISKIFGLIYVIILNVFLTLVPYIMQNTESIWMVARSSYAFASLFGLIILYTCVNIENEENIKTILFGLTCIVFIIVQFANFNKIEIAHYNLNYTDKMNSLEIGKMISNYQEETGIEVTKISIYQDESHAYTYQDIFASGDMNVSGFGPDWSDVEMINYYNGLKLERVEKSEDIQSRFEGKDWNDFSTEQIIFVEDTVHVCKF